MPTVPRDPTEAAAGNIVPVVSRAPCDLDAVIKAFESAAETLAISRPPTRELTDMCRQVAAFTHELFRGEWFVELRGDPEIRDDLYFVFETRATGTIEDIVARHRQWHRRLIGAEGKWHGLFRLSIDAS